jgi:pimeloyl-ACP methyl ester carboxylesterase
MLPGPAGGGAGVLGGGAAAPDWVAGVILLNSAGPFSDQLHPKQPQGIQKLFQTVLRQPWASSLLFQFVRRRSNIRKTLLKVYVNPEAVTEQLVEEIYRPSCDPGAAEVFASVFKTPQGEAVDHLLARLQVPLLTLWGEGDPWMKVRERGAKFRQHYPQLQEHYLDSGHCPHDDTPELVNDLIRQWALALT